MAGNLTVQGQQINIDKEGYINITDIAKSKSTRPGQVIQNWLRAIYTLRFLAAWERKYNSGLFNILEFEYIRNQAGTPEFTLSVKEWVNKTNAKGIKSKLGRYGGTYAQSEIAFEFCTAISPEFKLELIEQYQDLKGLDTVHKVRRELTKANHLLLTDAIQERVSNKSISAKKMGHYFASEMDMLNLVVFGITAKDWKLANPDAKGNIRDNSTALELLILANLEAINTYLIKWDTDQDQRFELLSEIANHQRTILPTSKAAQRLIKEGEKKK